MSTIGYESWAVDLADVGAVYPFQGSEVIMVILGVAFWLGFHIYQLAQERKEVSEELSDHDQEHIQRAIERY